MYVNRMHFKGYVGLMGVLHNLILDVQVSRHPNG